MKRREIIISREMDEVLENAHSQFGITKEQSLKKAFALLKIYTEEINKGNNFAICDKEGNISKKIV